MFLILLVFVSYILEEGNDRREINYLFLEKTKWGKTQDSKIFIYFLLPIIILFLWIRIEKLGWHLESTSLLQKLFLFYFFYG